MFGFSYILLVKQKGATQWRNLISAQNTILSKTTKKQYLNLSWQM